MGKDQKHKNKNNKKDSKHKTSSSANKKIIIINVTERTTEGISYSGSSCDYYLYYFNNLNPFKITNIVLPS